MNLDSVYKYSARTLLIFASATIVVAFLEWIADLLGFSIIGELYGPGRLLELAATLLIFVIAVLLQQIRDGLREGRSS